MASYFARRGAAGLNHSRPAAPPSREERGPIIDTVLSFLISAGIIGFGVWVVAVTIAAGLPWTLMGLLAVIVGLLSLYGSVRDAMTP
jgi:hypothetical protein